MSTLKPLENGGFAPSALARLTGGRRKFPTKLDFSRAEFTTVQQQVADRLSISGVQDKISLRLDRGRLVPTDHNGEYILKPAPSTPLPRFQGDVPANEHLTMQLASQVFGISTAVNALVRFSDGELAYVTKRFDRRDGKKVAQEDFCQLSGLTSETAGQNYKYDGSYEAVGRTLKRYCVAYRVEVERLFMQIVFNYAFSNGDAHLKNFSLFQSRDGDYVLTPAYDLLCTSMHLPNERRLALDLVDGGETAGLQTHGFETGGDFLELAEGLSMIPRRAEAELVRFAALERRVDAMIGASFLTAEAKVDYKSRFDDRLRALRIRR